MNRAEERAEAALMRARAWIGHWPSALFVRRVNPANAGKTIFCDPDPVVIDQLIDRGRIYP